MPLVHKVYRFWLKPNQAQERMLRQFAGARRWIWNWALAKKQAYYQTTGETYTKKMLEDDIVLKKKQPETAWLNEMDSQSLQQSIGDLEKAYVGFFEKRAKFPKFKKKGRSEESFRTPQRVLVKGRHLSVPKIGQVRLYLSQPVTLPTKSTTFKLDSLGHWYVTLMAQMKIAALSAVPAFEEVEGFDLGLSSLAATSEGEKIEAPKFYRKAENQIATANRSLSRKKSGGTNYAKQRRKLAKAHAKVAAQRREFIHRLTRLLTAWYKGICLEDLYAKGRRSALRERASKNQVSQEHPRRSLRRNSTPTEVQGSVVRLSYR